MLIPSYSLRCLALVLAFLCIVCASSATWASDVSDYLEYLSYWGKSEGRLTDPVRLQAFLKARELVKQHKHDGYNVTLNHFADWLPEELDSIFVERHEELPSLAKQMAQLTQANGEMSWVDPEEVLKSRARNRAGAPSGNLDWSDANNPCGTSVVAPVRDQGSCGACWAYAAISSIHASVFQLSSAQRAHGDKQGWEGRGAEDREIYGRESPMCNARGTSLELSSQELVDCDTTHDRGCSGGNPLYAYEYVMRHGLTSAENYPSIDNAQKCRRRDHKSVITIDSYVRLPAGKPEIIQRYLDDIGPVSSGICGTDPSFLYYNGGVYNPDSLVTDGGSDPLEGSSRRRRAARCCTTQNHAVLIVGYGYDRDTEQHYWKLQNSWGKGWGENGYMRLVRGTAPTDEDTEKQRDMGQGRTPVEGWSTQTCALDACPSVPLGGTLLRAYYSEIHASKKDVSSHENDAKSSEKKQGVDPLQSLYEHSRLYRWFQKHPAYRSQAVILSALLFIFCLMVTIYIVRDDPLFQGCCTRGRCSGQPSTDGDAEQGGRSTEMVSTYGAVGDS